MGRLRRCRDPGVDLGDGGVAEGSAVGEPHRPVPRGGTGEVEEVAQHSGLLLKPVRGYPPGPGWTPQPAVEFCGRGERRKPAPLQPVHRNQPLAPSRILHVGSRGAFWGPRNLKRVPAAGCGRWKGGIHSGSLSLQQRAPRNQLPVPEESRSLPTSEVLTAASVPVPAPRRRFLSDVSSLPTSAVLTAAAVPIPAPRRRFPPDVSSLPTSAVPTAGAIPVPVLPQSFPP